METRPSISHLRIPFVYSDAYLIHLEGLEKLHPFDTHKYKRIIEKLIEEKWISPENIFNPQPASDEDLLCVHTPEYLETLKNPMHVAMYLEFPALSSLSTEKVYQGVVLPHRFVTGGTILSGNLALEYPLVMHIGGGYHHAKSDRGEGFCLFADIAIAIRHLQEKGKAQRFLVVDLDVHQGNGTAEIFAEDERVFTFSMHEKDIYPVPKAISDCDVELEPETGDEEYLELLSHYLPEITKLSEPEMVFYVAGCDVLKDDPLASLSITEKGLIERDGKVVQWFLSQKIPLVFLLAGGYGPNSWHAQYQSICHILELASHFHG